MLLNPRTRDTRIRTATEADLQAVERLLKEASLPLEGVRGHFGGFLVAEGEEHIVGVIGLETNTPTPASCAPWSWNPRIVISAWAVLCTARSWQEQVNWGSGG